MLTDSSYIRKLQLLQIKKACDEDEESPENQTDNIPTEEVDVQSQEGMDQEELSTEPLPRVLNLVTQFQVRKEESKRYVICNFIWAN